MHKLVLAYVASICNKCHGLADLLYCFDSIRIYHEYEGGIDKTVLRITDWHHGACPLITNGDHEDRFFYLTLTIIMDSFSCSSFNTTFVYLKENRFSKAPEYAWMRHIT